MHNRWGIQSVISRKLPFESTKESVLTNRILMYGLYFKDLSCLSVYLSLRLFKYFTSLFHL